MTLLLSALAVVIGGALGATARWGIAEFMTRRSAARQQAGRAAPATGLELVPWPTFIANILACLLLGILVMRLGAVGGSAELAFMLLGVGFCGALSTVSTAALDVVNLVRRGATVLGLAHVLLTVGTGMAALWLGLVIGS